MKYAKGFRLREKCIFKNHELAYAQLYFMTEKSPISYILKIYNRKIGFFNLYRSLRSLYNKINSFLCD